MTTMKRMSVIIPADIDQELLRMKKSDQYSRCSYAELIRIILRRGLKKDEPTVE